MDWLPWLLAVSISTSTLAAEPVDFQKEVAPILSRACVRCHNEDTSKGKLSLSTARAALKGGKKGPAFVAGDPERSLLIKAITGPEPDMPEDGDPLSEQQVAVIRRWIEQGAAWPDNLTLTAPSKADASWWAFQPVRRPAVPAVAGDTTRNPIDAFVQATLKEKGLSPASAADARVLVRRLYFDLIGLPPTPAQVDAFVQAAARDMDAAIAQLADELLASSHYGERWGRHWLDIAHYADTHGFERDMRRDHAWRYRDYVINSFNSDKPYNQFLLEQIAGDVRGEGRGPGEKGQGPRAKGQGGDAEETKGPRDQGTEGPRDQGNRGPRDQGTKGPRDQATKGQGASDISNFRSEISNPKSEIRNPKSSSSPSALGPSADSIIATGFLVAGPFDFVGQVETASPTLRMQARADDLDDMVTQVIASTVGLTINCARCHDHKLDPITTEDYYSLWAVFAGVKRGDRDVPMDDAAEARRRELETKLAPVAAELAKLEGRGLDLADIVGGGDGTGTGKKNAGIDPRSGKLATGNVGYLEVPGNAFVKSDVPFVDGVAVPAGKAEIIVTSTGLKLADLPAASGKTWDYVQNGPVHSQASTRLGDMDFAKDGHTLLGLHANRIITFDLDAIRKKHGSDGSLDKLRFTATAGNGGNGGDGALLGIYLDGKSALPLTTLKSNAAGNPVSIDIRRSQRFLTLVALDGGSDISHDQVFLGDPRLRGDEAGALTAAQLTRRDELRRERDALSAAIGKLPKAAASKVFAVVPQPPQTVRILRRGDPESPDREVGPAAIKCVQTLPASLGDNKTPEGERRLALAQWIVDPANPLTRRVIVNRLWHYHFGTGIVATPSDFGYAGDRPSHPQLLDWLAEEMLARNWSLKAMHKLIVTSHTYRQSSAMNAAAAKIDAGNRLLWRMSPRRLEVEAVRDAVLAVAGTLNTQAGGPGFEDFTYQQEYAPVYRYITANKPALWRRTVYRYVVRTTQNEFLRVLDCSDPSILTPVRNRTTTALQALALMNNRFMIEQAGQFAARLRKEAGDGIDAQIKHGFSLAFGRPPVNEEVDAARRLVHEHGLESLCRMLLNANEFVYVD